MLSRSCVLLATLLVFSQNLAAWTITRSDDPMSGTIQAFAISKLAKPEKSMGFPYQDIEAHFVVACSPKREWTYIAFNKQPVLSNNQTRDGYSVSENRLKWDDDVTTVAMRQGNGEKVLGFLEDEKIINRVIASNSGLLELDWYQNGKTHFRFSMAGSSAAISKIRSICS